MDIPQTCVCVFDFVWAKNFGEAGTLLAPVVGDLRTGCWYPAGGILGLQAQCRAVLASVRTLLAPRWHAAVGR